MPYLRKTDVRKAVFFFKEMYLNLSILANLCCLGEPLSVYFGRFVLLS